MATDRILKLTSNPKPEEILTVLKNNKKCSNCLLEKSNFDDNFYSLYITYQNKENKLEKRRLSIYENRIDKETDSTYEVLKGKKYTSVYLSYNDTSMEIMTFIVEAFGGIFIDNDIDYSFKEFKKKLIKKEVERNVEMEKKLKKLENDLTFSF